LLPHFPARKRDHSPNPFLASGEPRASDAPPAAESIPFVQAALIGSLAAAVLAAVAVLISHS
jgi:hypothetical protein